MKKIFILSSLLLCLLGALKAQECTSDSEAPVIMGCPTTLSDGVVGLTSCLNATPDYSPFINVTDNCTTSDPTIVQIPPTGTMLGVGMFEIKLVATDAAGNASDTCRFTLNNTDITPPDARCQDIEVFLDANGMVTIDFDAIDNGSTDNCGIAEFSLTPNMFDCDDIANNPIRTLMTVTDNSGNTDTCSALVTVRDTTPPVLVCQDRTINLPADGDTLVNVFVTDLLISETDNCSTVGGVGVVLSSAIFTCAEIGDNEITIRQDDPSGNVGSCTVTLTIADPNAFCCAAPVASCTGTTVELDANGMASIMASAIGAGSTADCGLASETVVPSTFDCEDIGPNTVIYTITDINGAMSQCTTIVMVNDVTPPVVTCAEFAETFNRCPDGLGPNVTGAIITIGIDSSILSAVGGSLIGTLDFRNGCVSDNCTELANIQLRVVASLQENTVPGCSTEIINMYVALDEAGNESADTITFRAIIMFDGTTPPVITCPAPAETVCGATDPADTGMATATSGCGDPVITFVDGPETGSCGVTLETTFIRTWTATDGCGQTSTCEQLITVTDLSIPTMSQWALLILGMILTSLALVKIKKLAPSAS